MPSTYDYERRVDFADTDLAGIVHFANYLKYLEAAEHAFFRSLGFSICGEIDGCRYGWPRVHVRCDYRQPLRFDDTVRVRLFLRGRQRKAIDYVFAILKLEADGTETLAATAEMRTLCVTWDAAGKMQATAIPERLAAQLTPADAAAYAACLA